MQAIAGHRLNLAATDDVPGGRRHIPGANPEVQRLGLGPPRALEIVEVNQVPERRMVHILAMRSILVGVFAVASAGAQTPETAPQSPRAPVRVWASFGPGAGSISDGPVIAVDGELTLSRGALLIAGRLASMAVPFDDVHHDLTSAAVLFGARTSNPRAFATAAVGIAKATELSTEPGACFQGSNPTPCTPPSVTTSGSGLALEGGLHANLRIIGLGARLFTVVGNRHAKATTVSLSVDLGWLR
jgi:hypothetical protein